jgi:hypothetical protein
MGTFNSCGWELSTVALRREEYDLNGQEELEQLVFKEVTEQPQTYDIIKQQKERMEQKYEKQIKDLQNQVEILMGHYRELTGEQP